jgi:hypothetical protein
VRTRPPDDEPRPRAGGKKLAFLVIGFAVFGVLAVAGVGAMAYFAFVHTPELDTTAAPTARASQPTASAVYQPPEMTPEAALAQNSVGLVRVRFVERDRTTEWSAFQTANARFLTAVPPHATDRFPEPREGRFELFATGRSGLAWYPAKLDAHDPVNKLARLECEHVGASYHFVADQPTPVGEVLYVCATTGRSPSKDVITIRVSAEPSPATGRIEVQRSEGIPLDYRGGRVVTRAGRPCGVLVADADATTGYLVPTSRINATKWVPNAEPVATVPKGGAHPTTQPPTQPPKDPEQTPTPASVFAPPPYTLPITPSKVTGQATVSLPAAADAVSYAGGGRYLVLRVPSKNQIAVFDPSAGQVVKYLPLAQDDAALVGTMTKLFVVLPTSHTVEQWDLVTLAKEREVKVPLTGSYRYLAGHASNGPLFAVPTEFAPGPALELFDTTTFKKYTQIPFKLSDLARSNAPLATASPDGTALVLGQAQDGQYVTFQPSGGYTAAGDRRYASGLAGPDGRVFGAYGVRTHDLSPQSPNQVLEPSYVGMGYVPATEGPWYLDAVATIPPRPGGAPERVRGLTVRMVGSNAKLWSAANPPGFLPPEDPRSRGTASKPPLTAHDRFHLFPAAELLVILSGDKLHLTRVDLRRGLDDAKADYVAIVGRPPVAAVRGRTYSYELVAWSLNRTVTWQLVDGPPGMAVSNRNELTWAVPADFKPAEVVVKLKATSGGQEAVQAVRVGVWDAQALAAATPKQLAPPR